MNEHGLTLFDLTKKDFHLKLKKGADLDDLKALLSALPSGQAPVYSSAPAPVAAAPLVAPAAPVADGVDITSPMVGTAYLSPEPGKPAFAPVGTKVSEGQTVLIIEAMKTMNQIPAHRSGTISRILVDDSTPVEYGQPLVVIE